MAERPDVVWFRRTRLLLGGLACLVLLLPIWACLQSYLRPLDDIAFLGSDRVQSRVFLYHGDARVDLNLHAGPRLASRFTWPLDLRLFYTTLGTTGDMRDPNDAWLFAWFGTTHLRPIAAISAIAAVLVALRLRRLARAIPPNRCPACGYDLRATPDRCPECGLFVARATSP